MDENTGSADAGKNIDQVKIYNVMSLAQKAVKAMEDTSQGIIDRLADMDIPSREEALRRYASECFYGDLSNEFLLPLIDKMVEMNGYTREEALRRLQAEA